MSCAIIDAQLGIERVFGAADIWRSAIAALLAELPGALGEIESAYDEGRHADLQAQVHRLHGASFYCGTLILQSAARALELACGNSPDRIEDRLGELKAAVAALDALVAAQGIPGV